MYKMVQVIPVFGPETSMGQHILRKTVPSNQAAEARPRPLCAHSNSSDHYCCLPFLLLSTHGW